jgi:penicillin-binding protein 1A
MNHKRSFLKRHIKGIISLCLSAFFILFGLGFLWLATLKMPDLNAFETRRVAQSTKIYDRTGEVLLYDVNTDVKRTVVKLDDISKYIQNASVAIEDADFYSHNGIKISSIIRAVFANILAGGKAQGGSTITQQVVKNSLLTQDKTITRKIKEWVLALKLEKVLTKEQILEAYLNESPYGGTFYGVEETARAFFGKSAKNVTLAQAAYLAAIPQAPTYYSPYGTHREELDNRQRLVLQRMKEQGMITDQEYNTALEEKVMFSSRNEANIKAPHFVMYVK